MNVLIDARVEPGVNGGIEQALIGLVESMSSTLISSLDVTWLALSSNHEFIKIRIPDSHRVVLVNSENVSTRAIAKVLRRSRAGRLALRFLRQFGPFKYKLPDAPIIVGQLNPDVIHFPLQFGFKTNVPSIYQPHDLQHMHFPHYFSKETLYLRSKVYAAMMTQASIIAVGNDWTAADVRSKFPEFSAKIRNVPVNPQTLNIEDAVEMQDLPMPFLFYPAAFWLHKNHEVIFKSLAQLNQQELRINLVLTGAVTNRRAEILKLAAKYGVEDQIQVLGFVPTGKLVTLYRDALALVMPSQFESESLPIWEAFALGCPVIASNVTALPSQVSEAGLLFDPQIADQLTEQIIKLISSEKLRNSLIHAGYQRYSKLTPDNTAKAYFSVYEECAGKSEPIQIQSWFSF